MCTSSVVNTNTITSHFACEEIRIVAFESSLLPPPRPKGLTSMEDKCGRPLGLHFHPSDDDLLYIADSYKGLLLGNVKSGQVKTLVDAHHPGEGILPMRLTNDVTVLSNGSVFFTDSSSKFDRSNNRMEFLEGTGSGRLLHYNPSNGVVQIALKGLYFANGITTTPNEEHLLISETTRARIIRLVVSHLMFMEATATPPPP